MTEAEIQELKEHLDSGFKHDPELEKQLYVLHKKDVQYLLSLLNREQEKTEIDKTIDALHDLGKTIDKRLDYLSNK